MAAGASTGGYPAAHKVAISGFRRNARAAASQAPRNTLQRHVASPPRLW